MADFDWDYGKDCSSYYCCSIRTIVKLFCIGDRNDHYQRNPALGMVATIVSLVKLFCDGDF